MTKMIALCGKKQSGKTTLLNYLHGHEMKRHDIIEKFLISETGDLVVNSRYIDSQGNEYEDMGVLDLQQKTNEFYEFASRRIWPIIRGYNFADALKEVCVSLFAIPPECIYGSDEQKNQLQEHLRWENMPGIYTDKLAFQHSEYDPSWYGWQYHTEGPMTSREFMQFLGTDVMRKIWGPVWVNNCFNRINQDSPPIAVIGDCRFVNEIEEVQKNGGIVIRLTRSLYESTHQSEIDADHYDKYDAVIDNKNMTIQESTNAFLKTLVDLGVTVPLRTITPRTASIK